VHPHGRHLGRRAKVRIFHPDASSFPVGGFAFRLGRILRMCLGSAKPQAQRLQQIDTKSRRHLGHDQTLTAIRRGVLDAA
jgi:hypothetical protein